jgi:hypothetical protein
VSYIVRSWICGNPECESDFDSGDAAPTCPACGCVKVHWRPNGGHVMSAATKHNDRTIKSLANSFGLTDLKSARQGEAAHPGVRQGKPLDGMKYGAWGGIPIATTATAGFAPNPPNIKITGPSDGARKFKKNGRIPTQVRHVDPRKIVL